MTRSMRGDRASQGAARIMVTRRARSASLDARQRALQQEGADLIDEASALNNQPLTHAVERLQIELLGGLGRDELHGRALDCLGVASASRKSFFCPLEYGRTYFAGIRRAGLAFGRGTQDATTWRT